MLYYHIPALTEYDDHSTYANKLTRCGEPWKLDLTQFDSVPVVKETLLDGQKWGTPGLEATRYYYPAVAKSAGEIAAELATLKADALLAVDAAAVALDYRITTIGGNQTLEYAYRAQQIERWDLDATKDIDALSAPASCTILGQVVQAPARYQWGLLRCYYHGMLNEYPTATIDDAINKIRYERDLWLYILDQRAHGRLGELGKPAVRKATTAAEIIAARDAAIAFLDSIGA